MMGEIRWHDARLQHGGRCEHPMVRLLVRPAEPVAQQPGHQNEGKRRRSLVAVDVPFPVVLGRPDRLVGRIDAPLREGLALERVVGVGVP